MKDDLRLRLRSVVDNFDLPSGWDDELLDELIVVIETYYTELFANDIIRFRHGRIRTDG